jgi:hypothetical protein
LESAERHVGLQPTRGGSSGDASIGSAGREWERIRISATTPTENFISDPSMALRLLELLLVMYPNPMLDNERKSRLERRGFMTAHRGNDESSVLSM